MSNISLVERRVGEVRRDGGAAVVARRWSRRSHHVAPLPQQHCCHGRKGLLLPRLRAGITAAALHAGLAAAVSRSAGHGDSRWWPRHGARRGVGAGRPLGRAAPLPPRGPQQAARSPSRLP
eukprot:scaffold25053_cov66-Phaeocystis_antarctica.AAC.3